MEKIRGWWNSSTSRCCPCQKRMREPAINGNRGMNNERQDHSVVKTRVSRSGPNSSQTVNLDVSGVPRTGELVGARRLQRKREHIRSLSCGSDRNIGRRGSSGTVRFGKDIDNSSAPGDGSYFAGSGSFRDAVFRSNYKATTSFKWLSWSRYFWMTVFGFGSVYKYWVLRASRDIVWKIQKVWAAPGNELDLDRYNGQDSYY